MMWRWVCIIAVLALIVLVYKHMTCDCNKGKNWLGKVGIYADPQSAGKDSFVAKQEA